MRSALIFLLVVLVFSCAVEEYTGEVLPVSEVTDIQVDRLNTQPPQLLIVATGNVPSLGWTEPKLIGFQYLVPPANGIYDFNFVAKSPDGPAATVITPITATTTMIADGVNGVIIHSEAGQTEYLISRTVGELQLIYEITHIDVSRDILSVSGLTRTLGWSDPRLVLTSNQAGVLEYGFFARAPTGMVGQALSPIHASTRLPETWSTIIIHSDTNKPSYP